MAASTSATWTPLAYNHDELLTNDLDWLALGFVASALERSADELRPITWETDPDTRARYGWLTRQAYAFRDAASDKPREVR